MANETDVRLTDMGKLVSMLGKAGIEYTVEYGVTISQLSEEPETGNILNIQATRGSLKNRGYSGFHATFYFSKDGELLSTGVWE